MDSRNRDDDPQFVPRGGLLRVYQPAGSADAGKKNPCPDCHFCQQCSEARCQACRRTRLPGRRLSLSEQIALYERLNARTASEPSPEKGPLSVTIREKSQSDGASKN